MKVVQLPSGRELKITLGTFKEGKVLYQAILEEGKGLKLNPKDEVDVNFLKDLVCIGLGSEKIEAALQPLMKRALYNNLKMDENTFEEVEARQDYFQVCFEVAKENLLPFMSSLYAKFAPILEKVKSDLT